MIGWLVGWLIDWLVGMSKINGINHNQPTNQRTKQNQPNQPTTNQPTSTPLHKPKQTQLQTQNTSSKLHPLRSSCSLPLRTIADSSTPCSSAFNFISRAISVVSVNPTTHSFSSDQINSSIPYLTRSKPGDHYYLSRQQTTCSAKLGNNSRRSEYHGQRSRPKLVNQFLGSVGHMSD